MKSDTRVQAGQKVRIPPMDIDAKGEERTGAPSGKELKHSGDAELLSRMLLHEDDKVFVLNKPAGLAVQGGSGLTRHIDKMLEAWTSKKGEKPRLVHRLDRDTSGVLVVARTRGAAQKLTAAFRERDTKKTYWALVSGVPRQREGRISTWLVKEETPDGDRMRVTKHGEDGADHAVSITACSNRRRRTSPGWRWSPIRAVRTSCAFMPPISASDHRRPEIFPGRSQLDLPWRRPEPAASSCPPYRHSASLRRSPESHRAAVAPYGADVEPVGLRPERAGLRRMKLVLFDCDGTLVDSAHLIHEVMVRTFRHFELDEPEAAATHSIIGLTLDSAIARMRGLDVVDAQATAMMAHYKSIFAATRLEAGFQEPLFPALPA